MKKDIDSILLANYYFTKCKIENPISDKTELARKYLVQKLNKALNIDHIELKVLFLFSNEVFSVKQIIFACIRELTCV